MVRSLDSEIEILSNTEVADLIAISQQLHAKTEPRSEEPSFGQQPVLPAFKPVAVADHAKSSKVELGGVRIIKEDSKKAGQGLNFVPTQEPVSHGQVKIFKNEKNPLSNEKAEDYITTEETRMRLAEEIQQSEDELPLRIDSYNRSIKSVDQDLKVGLKKRQTKKEFNQLHKDLIESHKTDKNAEDDLDRERIEFTNALFKKK